MCMSFFPLLACGVFGWCANIFCFLGRTKLAKLGTMVTQPEMLVPIRLEIDHDHYRLRDTFTWNLNGVSYFYTSIFRS